MVPRGAFLNPGCRYPLSSSGFLRPSALTPEDEQDLVDPAVGLILPDNLPLALASVDTGSCELLFQRLIGLNSIRHREASDREINMTVPQDFDLNGFEVTNGWWGQSPISAEGRDRDDWCKALPGDVWGAEAGPVQ